MSPESPEDLLYLYHDDLFVLPVAPVDLPSGEGGFEKKVLLLFPDSHLTPETRAMLERMMTACGLQPSDYLMMGITGQNQIGAVLTERRPEKTLLFGVSLQGPGWTMQRPLNQAFRFSGMRFLPADPLPALLSSNEKKSALWQLGLKPFFNR